MADVTVRYAETHISDSLQDIALREMGDSSRWTDLIWLNDLVPPFITNDESLAGPRVLLAGQRIAVPVLGNGVDPDELETFGVDVGLDKFGKLTASGGDLNVVAGFENLKMALVRRLVTEKRTKGFSPTYGCWVSVLRGEKLGAAQLALAAMYVKSSLLEDDRVSDVIDCTATAGGDVINITAIVQPIDGKNINLEVLI